MKLQFFALLIFLTSKCSADPICDILTNLSESEISANCLHQLQLLCNNGSLLWRMFDASSKYPFTGMSYSNNRDLGNFDECVNIHYEGTDGKVKGKYCGLSVAIVSSLELIPNPFKLKTVKLRSAEETTTSMLSLCIPDQCSTTEVGTFFIFGQLVNVGSVNFIDSMSCVTKESNSDLKWGDIAFIVFLALVAFLVLCCTTYDFIMQKSGRRIDRPILVSFSLITNMKKLLYVSRSKSFNEVECMNGIRFISIMWIIAFRAFGFMQLLPLTNYREMMAYMDNPKIQYLNAGFMAVDTFFFVSAFLFSFFYFKSSAKDSVRIQISGIPKKIFQRYLRLAPPLLVLFFLTITIFRSLGSGPMYGHFSSLFDGQCRRHWWSFLLYIQNYVNYNDLCLPHTWYVSADMQMFILELILLIPVAELIKKEKTKEAVIVLLCLILISVVLPIVIKLADHTIDNEYDTHSRLSIYLIGILLGLVLGSARHQHFPFKKLVNLGIWCLVLIVSIFMILYHHNVARIYDHTSYTLFYGLYRPIWSMCLAWVVYSCHLGYGGPIGWFLSLPGFQIGARIVYCMYLTHYLSEMYWVGLLRTPFYFGDYTTFYLLCGHFIVTMVVSLVWSLCFEFPVMVVEKIIFG